MCGIVGVIETARGADPDLVVRMRDRLRHRGPDDAGIWCEDNVGLGHRRLSVIDLSAHGHQPMVSSSGRYVIVYNGEMYNFPDLKADLPNVVWRGHSDTEVIIEAIDRWGVEATLARCSGMFAFAVYDRDRHEIHIARDPLGIKPLYYGWWGRRFVFASELTALDALPRSDAHVDRNSLSTMLRYSQVPAPHSIYDGIRKLVPGAWLTMSSAAPIVGELPDAATFWSPRTSTATATASAGLDSIEAIDARAHDLLQRSVASQLVADVPVGAFLSGGIDSSLVVALMQRASSRPVKTFTIGFEQEAFSEIESARSIASHLGTDHTELVMGERELLDTVSKLPSFMDEPFGDSSILPTHLVSQLARDHVTVCLSGDGGDELGWGYKRYPQCLALESKLARIPRRLRGVAANALEMRPVDWLARRVSAPRILGRPGPLSDKLRRVAELLRLDDPSQLYDQVFMSHWKLPDSVVIGGRERMSVYGDAQHWTRELPFWRRMAVQDLIAYLPNDILTKVDRASMAVSLELRVPLLDQAFVEFCAGVPETALRTAGEPKAMLKRLLSRHVPRSLTDRPKQGFGVPLRDWLRGPLREWASDLLARERLRREGYFDAATIAEMLSAHLSARADWSAWLWDVLMFQSWLDARRDAAVKRG